jgi:hypothetical protein
MFDLQWPFIRRIAYKRISHMSAEDGIVCRHYTGWKPARRMTDHEDAGTRCKVTCLLKNLQQHQQQNLTKTW